LVRCPWHHYSIQTTSSYPQEQFRKRTLIVNILFTCYISLHSDSTTRYWFSRMINSVKEKCQLSRFWVVFTSNTLLKEFTYRYDRYWWRCIKKYDFFIITIRIDNWEALKYFVPKIWRENIPNTSILWITYTFYDCFLRYSTYESLTFHDYTWFTRFECFVDEYFIFIDNFLPGGVRFIENTLEEIPSICGECIILFFLW